VRDATADRYVAPSAACNAGPGWILAAFAGAAFLTVCASASGQEAKHPRHDYPTTARADYVIGCMAANGFRRELLDRCACGIDTIANIMSYEDYENASTILSMQQAGVGPRGGLFRDTPIAREETERLQRAQAEVNLRCG